MSINGIGVGYSAWQKTGKVQKNSSRTGFANKIAGADMVGSVLSQSDGVKATGQNSALEAYHALKVSSAHNEQDIYEALKSRVSNEDVKEQDSLENVTETDSITDMQMNMLVSETVQARFPLQEVDEEGNHKEEMYLIAVDKDGIRCSKPGQDEYEWEILFTDESQYENATEFLKYAGEFMDNFLFAAHENFWEDYLNGNMDVDAFKEFLEGTNNGIPDYSFTVGDSMYIDKEKLQWAQYMNPLGIKFYTAEEMAKMQAELIEKNTATAHKLSDPYSILYKKLHPEYNGERIFCEYPGGSLYTADEIMEIMNRNLIDAKYQAEARR